MLSLFLAEILAISGARLVPADPALEPRVVTVLIDGERISAVGEQVVVPEGARRIDAQGLFLCAAPIDGFAYWDAGHEALYASAGVSLIADHGNDVLRILAAKGASDRDGFPALRIAGAVIDGFPPSTSEASVARTPLEASAQILPLIEEGIDFVAFQSNLGRAPWLELIKVSHEHSRQVWGPLPREVSLSDALESGQDGFLFLDVLLPPGKSWHEVDLPALESAVAAFAKSKARIVPFLNGNARLIAPFTPQSPELDWLSPQFANHWRADLASRSALLADPKQREQFEKQGARLLELQRALLVKLHAAGVSLVAGSGAPHPWLIPGSGLHDELALWQAAGLAPREVLRLATLGTAQALGIDADRGSVEAGKFADLVLLREDPTASVAALRKPAWVILRGRDSSREKLDAGLAALRAEQLRAQEQASRPIEVGDPPKVEGELVLAGYCESSALGVRDAADRYTVVRSKDGKLHFCGRRVVPQTEGAPVEVETTMRYAGTQLEYFLIELKTAQHKLSVEGFLVASQTRVERKIDGVHFDLQTSREPISVVDVGAMTTLVAIAAMRDVGRFSVMKFHAGLELEVVQWELALEPDGAHFLRTPDGVKWARFDERGALKEYSAQRGSSGVRTLGSNTLAKERPGLPFSASKQKEIARVKAQFEAAQKAQEQPAPPKSGGDR